MLYIASSSPDHNSTSAREHNTTVPYNLVEHHTKIFNIGVVFSCSTILGRIRLNKIVSHQPHPVIIAFHNRDNLQFCYMYRILFKKVMTLLSLYWPFRGEAVVFSVIGQVQVFRDWLSVPCATFPVHLDPPI